MSMMASQITSVSTLRSNICSGADQRKHQSSTSLAFVRGIHWSKLRVTGLSEGKPLMTRGFPSQRASNVENVSIWWCHQVFPVQKNTDVPCKWMDSLAKNDRNTNQLPGSGSTESDSSHYDCFVVAGCTKVFAVRRSGVVSDSWDIFSGKICLEPWLKYFYCELVQS